MVLTDVFSDSVNHELGEKNSASIVPCRHSQRGFQGSFSQWPPEGSRRFLAALFLDSQLCSMLKVLVLLFAEKVRNLPNCLPVPVAYLAHMQLANRGLSLILCTHMIYSFPPPVHVVCGASSFLSPPPQQLDDDDNALPDSAVEDLVVSTGGDGDGDDSVVPLNCKGHNDHMVHPASAARLNNTIPIQY